MKAFQLLILVAIIMVAQAQKKRETRLKNLNEELSLKTRQTKETIMVQRKIYLNNVEELMDLNVKADKYDQSMAFLNEQMGHSKTQEDGINVNVKINNYLRSILTRQEYVSEEAISVQNIYLKDLDTLGDVMSNTFGELQTRLNELKANFDNNLKAQREKILLDQAKCQNVKDTATKRLANFETYIEEIQNIFDLTVNFPTTPTVDNFKASCKANGNCKKCNGDKCEHSADGFDSAFKDFVNNQANLIGDYLTAIGVKEGMAGKAKQSN